MNSNNYYRGPYKPTNLPPEQQNHSLQYRMGPVRPYLSPVSELRMRPNLFWNALKRFRVKIVRSEVAIRVSAVQKVRIRSAPVGGPNGDGIDSSDREFNSRDRISVRMKSQHRTKRSQN